MPWETRSSFRLVARPLLLSCLDKLACYLRYAWTASDTPNIRKTPTVSPLTTGVVYFHATNQHLIKGTSRCCHMAPIPSLPISFSFSTASFPSSIENFDSKLSNEWNFWLKNFRPKKLSTRNFSIQKLSVRKLSIQKLLVRKLSIQKIPVRKGGTRRRGGGAGMPPRVVTREYLMGKGSGGKKRDPPHVMTRGRPHQRISESNLKLAKPLIIVSWWFSNTTCSY